jgi:hypothetical protein
MSVFAQDRDRDRDRDDYRDENRWHSIERNDSYWRSRLFERVRADLDHVQAITPVFSGEQFRLARAKQELDELQRGAVGGRFDEKDLDDVISAVQRVLSDNRMPERDRNLLSDDLNKLRDVRSNRDRYYPRG